MPTPPFTLEALDHVVLRVRDVPPMLDFYCRVLGGTLEKTQKSIGLWQVRTGAALIDLLDCGAATGRSGSASAAGDPRNMDHFCLRVGGFDERAIRAWLTGQGARVGASGRRYGAEGSGPSIYVYDPEGNEVELKGPPDEGGIVRSP